MEEFKMTAKRKTARELCEGNEQKAYHATVECDAHGVNILNDIFSDKLRLNFVGSVSDHYDEDESYLYYRSDFYRHYNPINHLCWIIAYSPEGVLHFFCNELLDGHNIMIRTLFGNKDNFRKHQDHFEITDKLTSDPDEIQPFMYFVYLYYVSMIPADEWGEPKEISLEGIVFNDPTKHKDIIPDDFKEISSDNN